MADTSGVLWTPEVAMKQAENLPLLHAKECEILAHPIAFQIRKGKICEPIEEIQLKIINKSSKGWRCCRPPIPEISSAQGNYAVVPWILYDNLFTEIDILFKGPSPKEPHLLTTSLKAFGKTPLAVDNNCEFFQIVECKELDFPFSDAFVATLKRLDRKHKPTTTLFIVETAYPFLMNVRKSSELLKTQPTPKITKFQRFWDFYCDKYIYQPLPHPPVLLETQERAVVASPIETFSEIPNIEEPSPPVEISSLDSLLSIEHDPMCYAEWLVPLDGKRTFEELLRASKKIKPTPIASASLVLSMGLGEFFFHILCPLFLLGKIMRVNSFEKQKDENRVLSILRLVRGAGRRLWTYFREEISRPTTLDLHSECLFLG